MHIHTLCFLLKHYKYVFPHSLSSYLKQSNLTDFDGTALADEVLRMFAPTKKFVLPQAYVTNLHIRGGTGIPISEFRGFSISVIFY